LSVFLELSFIIDAVFHYSFPILELQEILLAAIFTISLENGSAYFTSFLTFSAF